MELDGIDVMLLGEVQRDAARPLHELGSVVGLSAPAVQRRLGRLKRSAVITGVVAVLDHAAVGLPITVLTFVTCERDRPDATAQMRERLQALPEAMQCYELTGTTDFVAVFVVPTMDRYKQLAAAVFGGDPNITKLRTHVVLDTVKSTTVLPLAAERFSRA